MKRKARFESENPTNEFSEISTPKHVNDYVDISLAVARHIQSFVSSKDFKQKDIADKLDKHESEISKWFNGFHNLTLKSIIKLESVCPLGLLNPAIVRNYQLQGISFTTKPISSTISSTKEREAMINNMYKHPEEKLESIKIPGPKSAYHTTGLSQINSYGG